MQSRLCWIIIHLFEKRPVAGDAGVAGWGRGGGQEASSGFFSGTYRPFQSVLSWGSQRDVVYLCWPMYLIKIIGHLFGTKVFHRYSIPVNIWTQDLETVVRIRSWIRICRNRMFLGLLDPDPLERGTVKQNWIPEFLQFCDFFMTFYLWKMM